MLLFVFSSKNLNFFLFPCGGRRVFFHDWRNSETDVFVFQSLDRNSLFVVGFFFFVFEREIMWSSEKNTSVCYFSHDSVCVCVCLSVGYEKQNLFLLGFCYIFPAAAVSQPMCCQSPGKKEKFVCKTDEIEFDLVPRSILLYDSSQPILYSLCVPCVLPFSRLVLFLLLTRFFFLLLVIPHRNLCQPPTFKHTGKWKRKKKSKQNINKPNCRGFPSKYNLTCFFLTPKSHIHSFFYAER